ncbi:hypothetical protein BS47DRAFT_1397350 [Hydnum rufescens UP504]|uniref:Uncharacterized protein n=1 Tax=Hydnum rufescens UP504 TaxID=1448309 RepID=A0A9P6AN92_9AGAM|nr:hypothetical protein BS47DRAFT_1397350 [Hydnum rufescens UP504]
MRKEAFVGAIMFESKTPERQARKAFGVQYVTYWNGDACRRTRTVQIGPLLLGATAPAEFLGTVLRGHRRSSTNMCGSAKIRSLHVLGQRESRHPGEKRFTPPVYPFSASNAYVSNLKAIECTGPIHTVHKEVWTYLNGPLRTGSRLKQTEHVSTKRDRNQDWEAAFVGAVVCVSGILFGRLFSGQITPSESRVGSPVAYRGQSWGMWFVFSRRSPEQHVAFSSGDESFIVLAYEGVPTQKAGDVANRVFYGGFVGDRSAHRSASFEQGALVVRK